MRLERVAIVTDFDSIPWAPIVLGFANGLRGLGLEVHVAPAGPAWFSAEFVKRWEPHAVLVALHDRLRKHVPAWRELIPRAVPFAALCFDDPYDMATPLALLQHFDLMLTPEPCCVEHYRDRGCRAAVLEPTVCDEWHAPMHRVPEIAYDVLHIGGRQWIPRREFVPALDRALTARGYRFGEVAGARRWIVGRDVTQQLHMARLTIDVPRFEMFSSTNPLSIPCTYVGPRVHIAAACGVPCVCIGPRDSLLEAYPAALTSTLNDGVQRVLELLDGPEHVLDAAAAKNLERFEAVHAPRHRAAQLLDALRVLTG